ncbi:hypothetical protein GF367_02950 [Candidatus Woesearchaeota archaeon]|nr:hypothetical protein [Candidatus Woesearchaeota archaeon]
MNNKGEGFLLSLEITFMIATLFFLIFGIVMLQTVIGFAKAENKYADEIRYQAYAYQLVNAPACFAHGQPNRAEQYVIDLDKVDRATLEACLPQNAAHVPLPVSLTIRNYETRTKMTVNTTSWDPAAQPRYAKGFPVTIKDGTAMEEGRISFLGVGERIQ